MQKYPKFQLTRRLSKTLTMETPTNPTNIDNEYSESATLIPFPRPIPLLRVPTPAAPPDHPFILAFQNPTSWSNAYEACERQMTQQCDVGARIGCSISASNSCALPWWKNLIGVSKSDLEERDKCEDREMAACIAASKEKCITFARDKCLPAFRDARIVVRRGNTGVYWRYVSKWITWVSTPTDSVGTELWRFKGYGTEDKSGIRATICRGSDLLEVTRSRGSDGN